MKEIPTSTVKIPTENKDTVKAFLVGKNKTIGEFYAEAALLLIKKQKHTSGIDRWRD